MAEEGGVVGAFYGTTPAQIWQRSRLPPLRKTSSVDWKLWKTAAGPGPGVGPAFPMLVLLAEAFHSKDSVFWTAVEAEHDSAH